MYNKKFLKRTLYILFNVVLIYSFRMGRSVFIEEIVEKRILKLFGETKWTTGILIGQVDRGLYKYMTYLVDGNLIGI